MVFAAGQPFFKQEENAHIEDTKFCKLQEGKIFQNKVPEWKEVHENEVPKGEHVNENEGPGGKDVDENKRTTGKYIRENEGTERKEIQTRYLEDIKDCWAS